MISFEDYFWCCRIKSYNNKVLNSKFPIRKLVNRCKKVNWDKMEEVSKLKSFQISNYLENTLQPYSKHSNSKISFYQIEVDIERSGNSVNIKQK